MLLINRGADVNLPDNLGYCYTPLIWAVDSGSKDIVNLLIREGANVNKKSKPWQYSPLQKAVHKNRFDLVRILLFAGADPNIEHCDGSVPLSEAIRIGYFEIAHCLIIAGADVNHVDNNGDTPYYEAYGDKMVELVIDARLSEVSERLKENN